MRTRTRIHNSPPISGGRRSGITWTGGAGIARVQFTDDTLRIAVREWLHNAVDATERYGNISYWDTSQVRDMSRLFEGVQDFNEPLDRWDTSRVLNMSGMFSEAVSFNCPLNNLPLPNEDFGRSNQRFRMRFRSTFQGCEY